MTGEMVSDEHVMRDMLHRVRECNRIPEHIRETVIDFTIDGVRVGKVTKKVANLLCESSPSDPVFEINKSGDHEVLTLTDTVGSTVDARTNSVMSVMQNLKDEGIIAGWRDELYPLATGFYDEPILFVERAAAPFLGMLQYGVHINGLVKTENGEERMWIARRSATKSQYPGMTDQIVAGGQPAGLGLMENVLKECQEEAGIPDVLTLKGIKPAGAVSYEVVEDIGWEKSLITRMVLFTYDLQLPSEFQPKVVDGEVEEFFQWGVNDQLAAMAKEFQDPMKPNCYLCVIDYLLRNGHISPEVPGYLELLGELRSGDCV
jgi:8-oxo-dGTP pyrophosphatase MutT (NUDIX family)